MLKIVALSWHPANSPEIISGGYRRFYEIAKRSHYPLVIIDRYPSLFGNLKSSTIQIREYGRGFNPKFLNFIFARLVSVVEVIIKLVSLRPDVIYVPDSELVHLTFAAVVYKSFFGSRLILANLNVNTFPFEREINIFLHKFADKIITISIALKKDLAKTGIFASYINSVGFEKPRIKNKVFKKYDAIYVGRHTPQKGIFDLIDVWDELVNKRKKNLSLITVGNIHPYIKRDIEKRIEKKGLGEYITLFGEVKEERKFELISASYVMVFPSHQEGWGIAPMEALSLGVPVIAYNLPVYSESIGKTLSFRVVKEGNISQFSDALIEILSDLEKYSRLANVWKPRLSWDEVAEKEWKIICSK